MINTAVPCFAQQSQSGLGENQELPNVKSPIPIISDNPISASAGQSQASMLSSPIISDELYKKYILGSGDSLDIHVIVGDNILSSNYNLVVSPGGAIFFPNVGAINISGLHLKEAENKIIRQVRKRFKDPFTLSLMLKQPKMIKVYVAGNAANAGPFTIYYGTRISEFLKMIGGAAAGGSSRTVVVKRNSGYINVDLYEPVLDGNPSKDIYLNADDIVEIPAVSDHRVTVMGEASRPGIYEIKTGEKLKDLLKMAGYAGVNSSLVSAVLLKRAQNKDQFIEYRVNVYDLLYKADKSQNIELFDGDVVTIPSIDMFVYVYGEVSKSGKFNYMPGKKLSDYINMAGGPAARANLSAVSVTRNIAGKAYVYGINANDILYRGIEKNNIEISAGDIISIPSNFFYFSDFSSFANTILLALTLYASVSNYVKK